MKSCIDRADEIQGKSRSSRKETELEIHFQTDRDKTARRRRRRIERRRRSIRKREDWLCCRLLRQSLCYFHQLKWDTSRRERERECKYRDVCVVERGENRQIQREKRRRRRRMSIGKRFAKTIERRGEHSEKAKGEERKREKRGSWKKSPREEETRTKGVLLIEHRKRERARMPEGMKHLTFSYQDRS